MQPKITVKHGFITILIENPIINGKEPFGAAMGPPGRGCGRAIRLTDHEYENGDARLGLIWNAIADTGIPRCPPCGTTLAGAA